MSTCNDDQRSLLDEAMPEYEFRGRVSIAVDAPPAEIVQATEAVTLAEMPLANALGTLRYLPGKLLGRAAVGAPSSEPFVAQLLRMGSVRLVESPDRELVIGTIGKLHQILNQEFVQLGTAEEFVRFDDPAYEKLAQSLRVEPTRQRGVYRLVLEHRTHALSPTARRKFARYWFVIKPMGNFVAWLMLRAIKRRAETRAVPVNAVDATQPSVPA